MNELAFLAALSIAVLAVAIHFQQHADGERLLRAWYAARSAWRDSAKVVEFPAPNKDENEKR